MAQYQTEAARKMAAEVAADRAKPRAKQNDSKPAAPAAANAGEAPTKHELGSDMNMNPASDFFRESRASEAAAKEAEKYLGK